MVLRWRQPPFFSIGFRMGVGCIIIIHHGPDWLGLQQDWLAALTHFQLFSTLWGERAIPIYGVMRQTLCSQTSISFRALGFHFVFTFVYFHSLRWHILSHEFLKFLIEVFRWNHYRYENIPLSSIPHSNVCMWRHTWNDPATWVTLLHGSQQQQN